MVYEKKIYKNKITKIDFRGFGEFLRQWYLMKLNNELKRAKISLEMVFSVKRLLGISIKNKGPIIWRKKGVKDKRS